MVAAALPYLGHDTPRALELINNAANPPLIMVEFGETVSLEEVESIALEAIDTRLATRPGWTCSDRVACARAIALAWEQAGTWLR
jgi:hypothetical protein